MSSTISVSVELLSLHISLIPPPVGESGPVSQAAFGRLKLTHIADTAEFQNKDLCGADLSGLDLDDVNLDGAIWSAETVWPTGDILDDIRARSCEICPGVYQIKDIDIDKLAFISILSLGPDRVSAMWRGC